MMSRLPLLIVLLLAAAAPLAATDFQLFQLCQIMIYAMAIIGLNLLVGVNGQLSLGHGAIFAIGAYTTAILMNHWGMPYWATLPVAALLCLVVGFLFGLPALRLDGLYLALATFGLALTVPQFFKLEAVSPWTGGVTGLFVVKPEAPFGLPLSRDQWFYYFTLVLMLLVYVTARNLVESRVGRALKAIRDHQMAAEIMGVDSAMYKSMTFGVSAMYTGLAGALSALAVEYVSPDSFTIYLSIFLLVGLVVGGVNALAGAFLGGAFILIVPNLVADISTAATSAIFGGLLILMMAFLPSGFWPLVDRALKALSGRKPKPAEAPAGTVLAGKDPGSRKAV